MNINHIFIDTNVLIGAYAGRQEDKDCLHYLSTLVGKKVYISALSIAQLVSVLQKKLPNETIRKIVVDYMHRYEVLSFVDTDITEAVNLPAHDIEDNIQYTISQKKKCHYFVTNNGKDFRSFKCSVVSPKQIRIIKR